MEDLGLDSGYKDLITLHDGTVLETHGPVQCRGAYCCVHNPSDHPLRDAPLIWSRQTNLMLRVCPHDSPHPDPDSVEFLRYRLLGYDGWHPCCDQHCCWEPRPTD